MTQTFDAILSKHLPKYFDEVRYVGKKQKRNKNIKTKNRRAS